jgi:SAM-dependent methyltransferase
MMDSPESNQHHADDYDATIASNAFDSYMDRWERRHVREIVTKLFPGKIPRYLDFACGTGRLTAVIAPLAAEVVGIDITESMLRKAEERIPSARFVQGDLTTEDHRLGTFDLVSSFRFFGNAPAELRSAVLRAMNPLLRKGGFLLINNHRNPLAIANLLHRVRGSDAPAESPGHTGDSQSPWGWCNTLTNRTLSRILKQAGFSILEARPIAVWQYRARMMVTAGSNPGLEQRLERLFRARAWLTLAPDAVILAEKVRDLDHAQR